MSHLETAEVADMPASAPNLNPGYHVIQSTVQAACDSDKSSVAEYANLSNSLPNLRLTAIGLANVERLQAPTPQQMCNKSRRNSGLREDEADWLTPIFPGPCEEGIDELIDYLFVVISLDLFPFGLL